MTPTNDMMKAVQKNLHFYFKEALPKNPAITVSETDVLLMESGIMDDTYNLVCFTKFTEENAENNISSIVKHYKEKNLPFSWWISPEDTPNTLPEVLKSCGFSLKEESVGMYKSLEEKPKSQNTDITITRICSKNEIKDFHDVCHSIGMHPDSYEKVYQHFPKSFFEENNHDLQYFIAYRAEKPVSSGCLVMHDQVAGIYSIITAPDERHKGYASRMMEHLLDIAISSECKLAILQASEAGQKVYEKIGFSPCCKYQEFFLNT